MNQLLKDERELLSKPGDTILETLEHIRMSQAELAERMGKTPSKVHDIISGKEPITVNTALKLEKVLNIDAQFWLNRETSYREKLARIEQEETFVIWREWVQQQPVKELKKCGFIKHQNESARMADELLRFYGVATPAQWENIYVQSYTTANFSRNSAHRLKVAGMSAWLRTGELGMRKIDLVMYEKARFKAALNAIKKLAADCPKDYAVRLQQCCAKAGVAVVYTVCLPNVSISGATRWISGNPLIQLKNSYKNISHFWFTFFHEAGHVLLHGKKDVFLEGFAGYKADERKEHEANEFASNWLKSPHPHNR